jgi:hypothetical protein
MDAKRLALAFAVVALLATGPGEARAVSPNVVVEEVSSTFVELVNRAASTAAIGGVTLEVGACAYVLTGGPLTSGQHHLVALTGYGAAPGADEVAPCASGAPVTLGTLDVVGLGPPPPGASWQRAAFGLQDTDSDAADFAVRAVPNPQNRGFVDPDFDGVDDDADNCDALPNSDQANLDGDGEGDSCDLDDDGDGVPDGSDICPAVAGPAPEGCPGPAPPAPTAATPAARPAPPGAPAPSATDIFARRQPSNRTATTRPVLSGLVVGRRQIRFRLSRAARVSLVVERCVRVRRKPCALSRAVGAPIVRQGRAGNNAVAFAQRRRLARGRYRVAASVAGSGTVRSAFLVS